MEKIERFVERLVGRRGTGKKAPKFNPEKRAVLSESCLGLCVD